MNTKAIYATFLFAALSVCTLSARAETRVTPKPYTYGSQLDIKKVLSLKQEATTGCGIVDARMTYLDSQDKVQVMSYRTFADGCIGEN